MEDYWNNQHLSTPRVPTYLNFTYGTFSSIREILLDSLIYRLNILHISLASSFPWSTEPDLRDLQQTSLSQI